MTNPFSTRPADESGRPQPARRSERGRIGQVRHAVLVLACWSIVAALTPVVAAPASQRVVSVGRMTDAKEFEVNDGAVKIVAEGPKKEKVARFDDKFGVRFDLASKGVDFHDFDLLKIQVKADAHAFLVVSLENFPKPGELSHWYVLDTARPEIPWRTIWIDLNRPEEVKSAGTYKGMSEKNPAARGVNIRGYVSELRQKNQRPGRSIWLSDVRFVKKAIDLDWDQSRAPYTWEKGKDLVYSFPLTVSNKADKPATAVVRLAPFDVRHARGTLSQEKVPLRAGETKTIEAKVTLPAGFAAKAAPLYCERFDVVAAAEGIADSDVTILRSSDVIPLSVTVPFAEDKLQFPLLPRVSTIPESVTRFNAGTRENAVKLAEEVSADDLTFAMGDQLAPFDASYGFVYVDKPKLDRQVAGVRFRNGLTACAFLYDFTGEKRYLEKGTQLLLRAAELFPKRLEEWRKTPYGPISQGIFAWTVLRTGWATGSIRWPYAFEHHGMFNDFDLMARDMDPTARATIIRNLLIPAAIQMRNHYFGLTNQQDVVNYPVMYVGLVTRNWPLVSHAYDSTHGLLNQIKYNFDDNGLAGEGNYHKPTVEPILYACELLRARGIDLYDERLHLIMHSPAAAAIKKSYNSPMLEFADTSRFAGKAIKPITTSGGQHMTTGMTTLRWNGTEVAMNWGVQLNRSAPDRCALRINELGGGNYTHSSLGQSIIIVDEGLQDPESATVLGYDVDGPVQYVCSTSSEQYPGSTITRTFACLGDGVLVLDRVRSDRARTVDWCLKGAGDKVSPKMREVAGGFTQKPDEPSHNAIFGANLKNDKHFVAVTDDAWNEGDGRLMMAGDKGTQIFSFRVPASFSAGRTGKLGVPVLMVRRQETPQTDFVAFFSKSTRTVERAPVLTADGKEADALGARITLGNGTVIQALVNYQPGTEVHLGDLKTKDRFATDFPQ